MEASSPAELKPGAVFATRFKIDEELPGDWLRAAFLATDERTQEQVLVIELGPHEASQYEPAVGLSHQHLAHVVEVIRPEEGLAVLVAEHVTGMRLNERLAKLGKKSAVDAVRSALRIADAVSALHAASAVHGGLSPASIVVEPEGHPAPAVTFAPPLRGASSYRSPERGDGPPSERDDAWAVTALLYEMLTGDPPPAEGVDSADEIAAADIQDEALCTALAHGLARDPDQRSTDLRPLKRELARWFVEHSGEDEPASLHHSHPPPLPPGAGSTPPPPSAMPHSLGQVPGVVSSMAPARKTPRRVIAMLAGGAIVLGLAAAWGVSAFRGRPHETIVEVEKAAAPTDSARAPGEIALNDVPVTGESEDLTGDKMATCVAGYLPKGSFAKAPDLGWMCKDKDPREGGGKLRTAVVAAAPVGGPTDAMKIFARLGWYEMAAYAVVRSGCCQDAAPIELPDPAAGCGRVDEALQALGRSVVAVQQYEAPLKAYTDALVCEIGAGRAALYRRAGRPHPGEQAAFEELVKVIQTP